MADPDPGSKPVSQKALVADIDRTRAELARTIDAITERVSPRRNAERAAGEFRARIMKIDPVIVGAAVAAAVVVGGVAVLLLVRRRRR